MNPIAQIFAVASLAVAIFCGQGVAGEQVVRLNYRPGPPDNPLKGLVPYAGEWKGYFPHSMEFTYLKLDSVVVGYQTYEWSPVENFLKEVESRRNQGIFRFYMEYPNLPSAIPTYLIKAGVKIDQWKYEGATILTPDYSDPRVIAMLTDFIAAFGARYDGDPRIAFLHAGLLGLWGEWHTDTRDDLFPSKQVQTAVLEAYESAFSQTRVLLRYPAGSGDRDYAENASRPFGYHDDSFGWATLHTGRPEDGWYFRTLLRKADATKKWRSEPIGGEIRPEAWGKVFDNPPGDSRIQDFETCAQVTHVSWLMDSGMFRRPRKLQPEGRWENAKRLVSAIGYDLYVREVRIVTEPKRLEVTLTLKNRGLAPFYEPWKMRFALLNSKGEIQRELPSQIRLNGIFPDGEAVTRTDEWELNDLPKGTYRLLVQGENPMKNGRPVRFANETQDRDVEGWLSLGVVIF